MEGACGGIRWRILAEVAGGACYWSLLMKSAGGGYWWRVLVEGAGGECRRIMLVDGSGGGCWWRVLAKGAGERCWWTVLVEDSGTFFAGTLIAWPEVAAVDVAVLRVFGVDAADADRGYVAGVDFPEQKLMDRMLQLCYGLRGLQWRRPSRCAIMMFLLTHSLIFVPGRSDLRRNIFMTKQSTAEKGSIY